MGQIPKVLSVTVSTAGTRVRVITDSADPHRYMRSGYFAPYASNTGNVYVGDAAVSSSLYTDALAVADRITFEGDAVSANPSDRLNYLDLYNVWVDADTSGNILFVTLLES